MLYLKTVDFIKFLLNLVLFDYLFVLFNQALNLIKIYKLQLLGSNSNLFSFSFSLGQNLFHTSIVLSPKRLGCLYLEFQALLSVSLLPIIFPSFFGPCDHSYLCPLVLQPEKMINFIQFLFQNLKKCFSGVFYISVLFVGFQHVTAFKSLTVCQHASLYSQPAVDHSPPTLGHA